MKREASELLRVAKMLLAASPLDGKRRSQVVRIVHEIINRHTRGFFTDEYWAPINQIWKDLADAGIDYSFVGAAEYQKNEQGVPTSKTWKFFVEWINEKGRRQELHGVVVASGAGSVQDPLGRYDVVSYVS